jgi:hypothetical protein
MALNACLMMSYDDDNHFFLAKAPQLISLLLSHVGVFDTSDTSTYKTLPYHVWPTQGGPKDSFEAEKERRHNLQSEMPLPNTSFLSVELSVIPSADFLLFLLQ